MSYLKEFQTQIANHNYPSFLRLWEEYCSADEADGEELKEVLRSVKGSGIAEPFGRHVEKIVPLWQNLEDSATSHEILKLIIDIQTTNSDQLRQLAYQCLEKKYGQEPRFNERIRTIGLKTKENFQGAISNYELLDHMKKGNYVFHTAGWGVGEIVDVSPLREQLTLEFDYVGGKKDLSFVNAFKTLIPIANDHFLAMRFGDPDLLEKKAKEEPVEVIRILLRDLGPKTAGEIKDELCDLVIPAAEWTRWWQATRSKLKKDAMIETPEELRNPFRLRTASMSHEERLKLALEGKQDPASLIQTIYSFMKDFPEALKNGALKESLQTRLKELLSVKEVSDAEQLQIHFFLEDLGSTKEYPAIAELIKGFKSLEEIVNGIEILAFKKRTLVETKKARADWQEIFAQLLFSITQNALRDYLLGELLTEQTESLKKKLEEILASPGRHPELFLWYFQKLMADSSSLPFSDAAGKRRFFESFLILLSHVEQNGAQKDLIKKMYTLLTGGRYAIVRQMMQGAPVDEVQEFLLLATKCHTLTDHDLKILHSLAEVVHPSLGKLRKKTEASAEDSVIWTTQEGYKAVQQRIQQIATVETVENAREIEVARSHGDLRENAEFKAALEKRDRLQGELKLLSAQLNRARIFTQEDISIDEVGIGTVVDCENAQGKKATYTLLGPWDANPDKNILSFQSKLAQAMKGLSVGDKFQFQGEEFTIKAIKSYL